jgi:hypothetical protein
MYPSAVYVCASACLYWKQSMVGISHVLNPSRNEQHSVTTVFYLSRIQPQPSLSEPAGFIELGPGTEPCLFSIPENRTEP